MLCNDTIPEKARSSIISIPSFQFISFTFSFPRNAPCFIVRRDAGNSIFVILEQNANASLQIVCTPSGITSSVKDVHP